MALIKADRVKETTTSTGTGTIALAGAATGYRAFSAVCAVGDTLYYAIAHQTAGEWEVGLATYSAANTLTRTTVHASSNSNLAVTFSAGTKDVFLSVTKAWLDTFLTTTSATTNYIAKTTGTGTIGDSQIFDNGTNVGIGTTSLADTLNIYSATYPYIRVTNASSAYGMRVGVEAGSFALVGVFQANMPLVFSTAGGGNNNYNERMRVSSAGFVGINETSPGAQLQVTTAAAATKGLIVKGASGQSARYIELQDSTGTVIAGVNSAGMGEFNGVYSGENGKVQGFNGIELQAWNAGAMRSAAYVYKDLNMQIGGTITPNANIGSNQLLVVNSSPSWAALRVKGASGQSANLQEWQNSTGTTLAQIDQAGSATVFSLDISGPVNGQLIRAKSNGSTYTRVLATSANYNLLYGGPDGIGINNYADSVRLFNITDVGATTLTLNSAAAKGLVVRGASGQSANLQEWQNNSGTALAYINSSGILVAPEIYAPIITDVGGVGYYKQYFITRTLPDTVGDYVEFLEYNHTVGTRFKIDVMTADYPYWDNAAYEFNVVWDGVSSIMPPKFRYHRNTSDFVLEKAYGQSSPYQSRLRLRRIGAKSHASSTTVRIRVEVWATSVGGFPTDASATGTSTLSNYGSDQSFCNPVLQAPPQLVAGSGTSISLSPSQYLTSGNNGEVIVYGNVENSDGTPPSTLKLYGGTTSGDCSRLMLAHHMTWNNGTPFGVKSHYELRRTLPTAVGDYIELFKHGWGNNAHFRITIITSRSSWIAGTIAKVYEFQPSAGSFTAVFPPTYSWGGDSFDDYVLERVFTTGVEVRYRLRRTASTSTIYAYVHVELFNSENMNWIQMLSGTGTSTVGNNYFDQGFSVPSVSAPVSARMSGNASDLSLYGASANGTGNGGNILLQAGAYATSGSNGKVIVRGLASNTANLQEWQNNAGTALASIDSSGRLTIAASATASNADLYFNNSNTVNPAIKWNAVSGATGLRFYSGSSLIGAFQDNGAVRGNTFTTWGGMNFGDFYLQRGSGGIISFNSSGPAISVGAGTLTTADSTMQVVAPAASKKGLVVSGAASQTGNLQEWQNSSGTALASVDSAGQIVSTGALIINQSPSVPTLRVRSGNPSTTNIQEWQNYFGTVLSRVDANGNIVAPEVSTSNLNTYQWFAGSTYVFSRIFTKNGNLPSVVGNYVELFECTNSRSLPIRIAINANDPHQGKVYDFVFGPAYYGGAGSGSIIPPLYSANADSSNDFELEVYHVDPYLSRFRLRRTAGTSNRAFQAYINVQVGNTGVNFTSLSGTGTSTLGSTENPGYGISTHYIKPVHASTYTGNGRDLTLVGASGQGTGNGGNIILQAGAYSTSGSNGKVIVRGLASNTANLQEWQNNAGTALARVTSSGRFSNPNGFGQAEQFGNSATASSEYATAFGFNATGAGSLCTAVGWQVTANGTGGVAVGASTSTSNHYKPVAIGAGSSTGADRAIVIGGDSYAGGGYSIAIGSAVAANGTGSINIGFNSTVSANNVTSIGGTYTTDTYLYGTVTTTLGTATQKGFVVKAASGQSANLLELQNNSGTALATIDSAGRIGVGTAPQAGYSLYGTGSIYAGGGGVLVAGNAGLFYLNGRVGIGTGTGTPVFGCEYTNYMRPIILSGYPDGAGYIGTIINTSSTYANATAKLLSVQNNGTEKFAVFSDGSMAGVDARLTGSIQITSNTPAAFTADQNNLVLNASGFQRLSGTAARTITGIAPPSGASHVDGRIMRIYNVGSYNITLKHNSTSSSIANRFCCVQAIDIVLGPRDFAELIYDATDGGLVSGQNNPCWRVA